MSAQELIAPLADDNGEVDLGQAAEALRRGIGRLQEQGAQLPATDALSLFMRHVDNALDVVFDLVTSTQAALVRSQQALDRMLRQSAESLIPDYDQEDQLLTIEAGLEVGRLALTYDALEATLKGTDDEDTEAAPPVVAGVDGATGDSEE